MTLRNDFDRVYRSLSRVDLQKGAGGLELPEPFGAPGGSLFLGYYTVDGLRVGLERYGFFRSLEEAGYRDVRLEIRCEDPEEHLFRVWSVDPEINDEPLLELVARRDVLRPTHELEARLGRSFIEVLNIQWLQLQRPNGKFAADRPPLPGQRFPGLGLGEEVLELLRQAAKRLSLEALVTVPSYFHNAYFYSEAFQYVDPREQGVFLALCRDVLPRASGLPGAASWAIVERMVVNQAGEPFEWFHDVMLAPLSDDLAAYLAADEYHQESGAALRSSKFDVFEAALRRHLESRGISPLDADAIERWIGDRV